MRGISYLESNMAKVLSKSDKFEFHVLFFLGGEKQRMGIAR
jgi:hypothetical protein